MSINKRRCVLAIDLDGTIIPNLIDFDKLRNRVRAILGVDHPLKPLGESLALLIIDENAKQKAWELIEKEEMQSVSRLDQVDVASNVHAIIDALKRVEKVVIVTMRSSRSTEMIMDKIGILNEPIEVITRDHFKTRKEQLIHMVNKYREYKLIFIGDTDYDEQSSRAVGVEFIRVDSYKSLPSAIELAVNRCEEKSFFRESFS